MFQELLPNIQINILIKVKFAIIFNDKVEIINTKKQNYSQKQNS